MVSRSLVLHLDTLKARRDGDEEWDVHRLRLRLLAACGSLDDALEHARTHPEGDTWYAAWTIAELLAEAGRTEDAVTDLESHAFANSSVLAFHLIDLGRIKDAVAVLQQRQPQVSNACSDEHPVR